MGPFNNISTLIIDMDGVLWHGDQPIPGLVEFFQVLRERQIRFILATNNASQTAEQYVNKLARMGVTVDSGEILTSAMATALYLAQRADPSSTRVFVIGEKGATEPLLKQGFTLTGIYEVDKPGETGPKVGADYVVCGMDKELTWHKLATAALNINNGAIFIGTNPDTSLPTELGFTHGNGAIIAALQAATGVAPIIIGKPEPLMYQQAISILGVDPSETMAIGDRLETDILGAVRANMRSLMVLTGVSSEEDLKTSDYQPDWVMADIRAVTEAIKG